MYQLGTALLPGRFCEMAVLFREITEDEVDATRITLRLMVRDDDTVVGRIVTLAVNGDTGKTEMMSTAAADPPIKEAIRLAADLANFKEQGVDVFDPEKLWTDDLGPLLRL